MLDQSRRCDGKIKRTQAQVDSSGESSTIPIITRCPAEASLVVLTGNSRNLYCQRCFEDICDQLPKNAVVKELHR